MKLNPLSKMMRTVRAAVVATVALLSLNAVRAAEFFDDSVIAGTKSIHGDEVADAATPMNEASTTVRVAVPIDLGDYQFSHIAGSPAGATAQQPGWVGVVAELLLVPKPGTTAVLGMLGVLGFLAYRMRRRLSRVWNDGIVEGMANFVYLIWLVLEALVKKIRPSATAK